MKRPKWFLKRAVLGGALASVAVALAAFVVVTYVSEGSHSGLTGSSTTENKSQPLTVSFPNGVSPQGGRVEVTVEATNTTSAPVEWSGPKMEIVTPGSTCASQLELYAEKADGTESVPGNERIAGTNTAKLEAVAAGAKVNPFLMIPGTNDAAHVWLQFKSSVSKTDLSCAEKEVQVKAKLY